MINIAIYDEKAFQEKMRKTIVSYMEQKEVEFSIGTFGDERDFNPIFPAVPVTGRLNIPVFSYSFIT